MTVFSLDPAAMPIGYGEAILPLDHAKQHLRVDATDEDSLIALLRDAAVDLVERYCSIPLGPRSGFVWQGAHGCFVAGRPVHLGVHPVTAIISIDAIDATGATITALATDFTIGPHDRLQPKPTKEWPDATGGATIIFDAGYGAGEAGTKVPGLVAAVRLFLGHLYENREAVATHGIEGEIPLGVMFACARYRMPAI